MDKPLYELMKFIFSVAVDSHLMSNIILHDIGSNSCEIA